MLTKQTANVKWSLLALSVCPSWIPCCHVRGLRVSKAKLQSNSGAGNSVVNHSATQQVFQRGINTPYVVYAGYLLLGWPLPPFILQISPKSYKSKLVFKTCRSLITKVRVQVFMIQTYSCYTLQKEVVYSIQSLPRGDRAMFYSKLSHIVWNQLCLVQSDSIVWSNRWLPFNHMLSQNEPPPEIPLLVQRKLESTLFAHPSYELLWT